MVAATDAPPERLYRPDVSLLEWRRLVEEGHPLRPPNRDRGDRAVSAAGSRASARAVPDRARARRSPRACRGARVPRHHARRQPPGGTHRPCSSTAAVPAASAWTDFGPVAPVVRRRTAAATSSTCCSTASPTSRRSPGRCGTTTRPRSSACSTPSAMERADFVCNSWGGTIALASAAEYPERVRSLVVTGSMPVFYGPLAPLPEGGRRGRNAPRRLLRRRGADAREDARPDGPAGVVRRRR